MRILLISTNREKIPYPVEPIGLTYIASSLQGAGHEVRVIDLCFEDDGAAEVVREISGFGPELIGLSIRNVDNLTYPKSVFYLPEIKKFVDEIKKHTDAPMVAGGSGFSLFPEETLEYLSLDYGVIGEGEEAVCAFAESVRSGRGFELVPGLVVRSGPAIRRNRGLELSGFGKTRPARELLDSRRYAKMGGMANIQTKRGCPFDCTYCTYPVLEGRSLRLRDPADVADEVESINRDYGQDYFFFVDDIFNIPQSHALGICEEIIKRRLKIRWACFASPKSASLELFTAMKCAGCSGVEFGTDGGTDETLAALGKGFTVEDVMKVQSLCSRAGLEAAHYLILGGPGETPDTLSRTFGLMERIKPRAVIALTGVRIYPGTALARRAAYEGVIHAGESLLEPRFYISGRVRSTLLSRVKEYALSRPNWVVPGLDIRSSEDLARALAMLGKRGIMWDMLGN